MTLDEAVAAWETWRRIHLHVRDWDAADSRIRAVAEAVLAFTDVGGHNRDEVRDEIAHLLPREGETG